MNSPAFSRHKPDEHFIQRIKGLKPALKGKPWKAEFLQMNPAWNNVIDLSYLNRVYLGRTADVFVTESLETIAEKLK